MAQTKIIWTATALDALEAIGLYIAQDAPERAVTFTDTLYDSTLQLEEFPLSGGLCPEDPACRQIVVEGYRIIYEISQKQVEVLTIISPGQDAERILSAKK